MVYNGINFYEESWAGKTEAEFLEHEKHHDLTTKQLKEAWALMFPKKEKKSEGVKNDDQRIIQKD